ncbi:cellulase family glycosylhydrolase [Candidatus Binatia bacterium]|nr:cellulase family glycosylhydrolase [Candidatus Binatia bacterium]
MQVPFRPQRPARASSGVVPALLALVLVLAACSDRGLLSPPTLEPLLVHVDGPWLRDAKGRVVLLRGANVVTRDGTLAELPTEVHEQDFAFLASLGFNLVRLPIPWAGVEPRPGFHDFDFLRGHVDPLLRAASDHGMQVILALQTIRWSSCFRGERSAAPWMCTAVSDGPAAQQGFGARDVLAELKAARAQCSFLRDARAADDATLREHFAVTWGAIAHYYDQDRRIFGFDLIDEPSATGCMRPDAFVTEVLTPFYGEIAQQVRAAAAPQALVYQPGLTREDPLLGVPAGPLPGSIFAPHLFGQTFGAPPGDTENTQPALGALYARATALARAMGGPLVVGEIGADGPPIADFRPATRDLLAASLDELDRTLAGGAVWALVLRHPGGDATAPGIGNDGDAAVLARPFARRIAGIPQAMRFDTETGEFRLRFVDDPDRRPPDPSEIFVAATQRYPQGFSVEVTKGDRWTFDAHNQRVLVYRGPGSTHEVTIRPALAPNAGEPTAAAAALDRSVAASGAHH